MMYDAVIVGAGPAGSYLGYQLARNGFAVAILDKERFPRDKVCGGGITEKTIQLMDFDISPVIQQKVAGAYLTYRNVKTMVKDLGGYGGVTVLRSDFDNLILEKARAHGANVHEGCAFVSSETRDGAIEVSTSRGALRCRYLIGADGVYSRVRNSVFGKGAVKYVPAVEALVYVPPDIIERYRERVVFDFGGMRHGYGWIFPKRDHLNVGVFSVFRNRALKAELFRFISRYRLLQTATRTKVFGHAIPLKNVTGTYQRGNVWLVGDAAGVAESFYGEGIYFALRSATIAAEALRMSSDRPDAVVYSEMIRRELGTELTYSRANARMFFLFPGASFEFMVLNKSVNSWFAGLISGSVGHRQAFYRTIGTLPFWLFSGRHHAEEGLVL
jgi:geranylgeranyl reductase family protein